MKKVLFLLVLSLFVFSGAFGAESMSDENNINQEQAENEMIPKNNDTDTEKLIIKTDKVDRKVFKKIRKEYRKFIKDKKGIKKTLNSMLLVGAVLMGFGLLLYLIVQNAIWLGIAVMVLGLVLLLYGVLQKFF